MAPWFSSLDGNTTRRPTFQSHQGKMNFQALRKDTIDKAAIMPEQRARGALCGDSDNRNAVTFLAHIFWTIVRLIQSSRYS